jgi:hypothetical protein
VRRAAIVALAVALGCAGGTAPAAAADRWHNWAGTSGDDAGHGVVSRGEAIWTNYLYDDYGANVDGFQSMDPDLLVGLLSPHAYPADPTQPVGFAPSGNVGRFRHTGDYGYPPDKAYPQDPVNDPFGDNTSYQNVANVAEVRVAADASNIYLRFALTDLGGDPALGAAHPDSTVIGVALDTDGNSSTGGGAWPFSAQISSPGWDRMLTVWGTGGTLTTPDGATRDISAAGGAIREDLAANTLEVRLPLDAVAPAGRRHWTLIAGAGRWDAASHSWAEPALTTNETTSPGSLSTYPRLYELPFHHDEPNSLWNDTKQANDLRAGSIGSDGWSVDVAQLQAGTSSPVACRSGPREETFNAYSPGSPGAKGITALPTQNGGAANVHNVNEIYRWRVQPLALMLPPSSCDPASPAPSMDYVFHPANVNQNAWTVGVEGDHARVNYLSDPPLGFGYVTDLANRYNRITASGLGRTEGWNYGDAPGEEAADHDAFTAATQRYRHDPDHVRVLGMSGRLGAPFFAETWPDRVSSMFTVSPHTADTPKLVNLRNTPWVFAHGTAFLELNSDLPSYATVDDHLSALGYQYLHMTFNGRGHDFNLLNDAYGLVEPWTSAARIHPARVTYYIDPKDKRPGVPQFSGVDWVRTAALADQQQPAQIDLTDLARASSLPVRETRFSCSFLSTGASDALDYHGLSYEAPEVLMRRMPDVVASGWSVSTPCTFEVKPLARPAVANAITGTLHNVSAVTVDLDRMGIDPRRGVDLSTVRSDGPLTLHLRSRRGGGTVRLPLSRCTRVGTLRYRLRRPRGRRVVRAIALVNGRLRRSIRGASLRRIAIARPADDAFAVTIRERLDDGSTITITRRYNGCATTRPTIRTHHGRHASRRRPARRAAPA